MDSDASTGDWTLVYEGFSPAEEGHREALCTLGNGFFATDHREGSVAVFVEVEQRVADNWKVELESRLFVNVDTQDPLAAFQDDDYVLVRISYFH